MAISLVVQLRAPSGTSSKAEALAALQKILLCLVLSDACYSLALLLSWSNRNSAVCDVQAVAIHIGSVAGFGWLTAMSVELFLVLVKSQFSSRERMVRYHVV